MDPQELLDLVEELFRLDPHTSYLERGAGVVARIAGADSHVVHTVNRNPAAGSGLVMVPLRHGKSVLGVVELRPCKGASISPESLRLARTAARLLVRGLLCAQRLSHSGPRVKRADAVKSAVARSPLTPRERQVVLLLVAGSSTRLIAKETGLTVATVHTYLKRIYPKLGVHSRVELVARMVGTHGV